MLFSVIYSVDVPATTDIRDFVPPQIKLWQKTEGNSEYDYGYLEGHWKKGKHRKWCALLTREQFDEFVQKIGLHAESTNTGGSLGAPGFGHGWAPAISFTSEDMDAIISAYVTPVPESKKEKGGTERDWERIRRAVLSVYK